jgi:antitoxin ParD1/3/4
MRTTLNISLPSELHRFVNAKVDSGLYTSASEVVRESLRLLEKREREHQMSLGKVRRAITEGLVDLDAGRTFDGEEVFGEILGPEPRRKRAGRK